MFSDNLFVCHQPGDSFPKSSHFWVFFIIITNSVRLQLHIESIASVENSPKTIVETVAYGFWKLFGENVDLHCVA